MTKSTVENAWEKYIQTELTKISKIINPLGFSLDDEQPHIGGERYLMTKNKLVLAGKSSDNKRVIIKMSNHPDGKKEIITEKKSRDLLETLSFADDSISFPEEILYKEINGYLIFITLFISQEKIFVDHSIEEQFFIILRAFESQESFHMTTFEHRESVYKTFKIVKAIDYINSLKDFSLLIKKNCSNAELDETILKSINFLESNSGVINKYSNYLTHTDFVPHNFRIKNNLLYMLDCSAVQFGNKYEGWARLLNYMILHSPKLEKTLTKYIIENRNEEEYLSLRLLRIFKTIFLLNYYAQSLPKTDGDLRILTITRIDLWHKVLKSLLDSNTLNESIIEEYLKKRDNLRSEEEKNRQREFAKA